MGPAPGVELLMGIIREFHEKCAKIRWQKSLNYVNGLFFEAVNGLLMGLWRLTRPLSEIGLPSAQQVGQPKIRLSPSL